MRPLINVEKPRLFSSSNVACVVGHVSKGRCPSHRILLDFLFSLSLIHLRLQSLISTEISLWTSHSGISVFISQCCYKRQWAFLKNLLKSNELSDIIVSRILSSSDSFRYNDNNRSIVVIVIFIENTV